MKKLIVLALLLVACAAIDTTVKKGNEGFVIGNGSTAVLLTHGLAASPCEVSDLAHYLAHRNLTVYVVRLAGHGTSLEDLDNKTWQDWYADYHTAYETINPLKQKIFVGGMSLGGLISLKLAEDEKVDGIIALAPSLSLYDGRTKYAWLIKYFVPHVSRVVGEDCAQYYYPSFSVSAISENLKMADVVKADLSKITAPLLLLQYRNDTRISTDSSKIAYDGVSSEQKELHWINGTGHVMILGQGKEKYFEQVYQFIKSHS